MAVDRALVEAWVEGWTLARRTPAPVADSGGLRVDVGWPEQTRRYVFHQCAEGEARDGLSRLGGAITESWVFLKVAATSEALAALLPPRWRIDPLGFMMSCDGAMGGGAPTLAEGYHVTRETHGAASFVGVLAPDGDLAASGHVALTDGGHAIYDRIVTHEDHRRRGLGRVVMKTLEAMAGDHGVDRHLLVATPDGRALYEALGWTVRSPYATAVIPGADRA